MPALPSPVARWAPASPADRCDPAAWFPGRTRVGDMRWPGCPSGRLAGPRRCRRWNEFRRAGLQFQAERRAMQGRKGVGMFIAGASRGDRKRFRRPEGFTRQAGLSGFLLRHGNRGAGRRNSGSFESRAESRRRSDHSNHSKCRCRGCNSGQQSGRAHRRQLHVGKPH